MKKNIVVFPVFRGTNYRGIYFCGTEVSVRADGLFVINDEDVPSGYYPIYQNGMVLGSFDLSKIHSPYDYLEEKEHEDFVSFSCVVASSGFALAHRVKEEYYNPPEYRDGLTYFNRAQLDFMIGFINSNVSGDVALLATKLINLFGEEDILRIMMTMADAGYSVYQDIVLMAPNHQPIIINKAVANLLTDFRKENFSGTSAKTSS